MANSRTGDSVVDRVVRLIEAFPEGSAALQLSDLADRAGLPLTTAHRLVRQLAGHGLLELGDGGSVRLGLRLWELVNRNSPTLALRQAAMPFMEDIQQVLNQNVNLAVLDGWEALFVERLSRRGSVANRAKVAGRMPVHLSSAGLVLMAHQPAAVQAAYLRQFNDPAGRLGAGDAPGAPGRGGRPGLRAAGRRGGPGHLGDRRPGAGRQEADGGGARRRGSAAGGAAAGAGAGAADRGAGHRPPARGLPHRR